MSNHVEVGAVNKSDNKEFPTKTALRRAIQTNPDDVVIYTVSVFNDSYRGTVLNADKRIIWQVTGPNPYTRRNWYANVHFTADGRILVK